MMNQDNQSNDKKKKTLTLGNNFDSKVVGGADKDQVRQSFSHGRTKTVQVEIKRKRSSAGGSDYSSKKGDDSTLTQKEIESRLEVLKKAMAASVAESSREGSRFSTPSSLSSQDSVVSDSSVLKDNASQLAQEKINTKSVVDEEKNHPQKDLLKVSSDELAPKKQDEKLNQNTKPSHFPPKKKLSIQERLDTLEIVEYRSDDFDKPKPKVLVGDYASKQKKPEDVKKEWKVPVRSDRESASGTHSSQVYHRPRSDAGIVKTSRVGQENINKNIDGPSKRSVPFSHPKPSFSIKVGEQPIAPKEFSSKDKKFLTVKKRSSVIEKQTDTKKAPSVRQRMGEGPKRLNHSVLNHVLSAVSNNDDDSVSKYQGVTFKTKRIKGKNKKPDYDVQHVVREVIIPDFISVGELASRMAVRGPEVVKALMKLGMMTNINQNIDADTAELICNEFNHTPKRVHDNAIEFKLSIADQEDELFSRPPVVTVMGHVDHGKTSLLDALRSTDVVGGEAGGITQHIGAYQITLKSGEKITFIDTPGHAAFSQMRARGANVTDIVVLVVAADDGVKEQTLEALSHARAANVPIIIAINKIDKPQADPARVKQELLNHNVVLEEYGGDVMAVEVSAKNKKGLDTLEETILLQAEVMNLRANPNRRAQGIVVEARMEKGRGNVVTMLVQHGTLSVGDIVLAGMQSGRVRALINDHGKKVQSALPSVPVEVLGFTGTPSAGDEFFVVEDEVKAREICEYRQEIEKQLKNPVAEKTTIESMLSKIAAGEVNHLPLIIKADVHGSLEAIAGTLLKIGNEEIKVKIIHSGVGAISESDVSLAKSSGSIILGFNVRANVQAKELSDRSQVDIRYYSIIYNLIDEVKMMLSGLLAPTLQEKYLGRAQVREVFSISKVGKVAGCYVEHGIVKRGAKVRLLRDNIVIHEGDIKSLRRFKDEIKEVRESYECGIVFESYQDIKIGDIAECFEIEKISRQID
jgi:translation initiation factor IF-2